jgi:hypothetical protein
MFLLPAYCLLLNFTNDRYREAQIHIRMTGQWVDFAPSILTEQDRPSRDDQ